jgi:hypothetical protein
MSEMPPTLSRLQNLFETRFAVPVLVKKKMAVWVLNRTPTRTLLDATNLLVVAWNNGRSG